MSNGKIRALIVDDEPLAHERIRTLLRKEPDIEVVAECGDGSRAVTAIEKQRPDLVFLDVQMPEADGFEVVEAIGAEQMPAVIFVTAYDEYALRAFDVNALDYLLKPFDRARFRESLERARQQLRRARDGEVSERLLALLGSIRAKQQHRERLVVREGGRIFFLRAEEIDWIEAAGNYLRLHAARQSHLIRETMAGIEAQLDPAKFARIHRSTIVNLDRVRELLPGPHGDSTLLLRDGARLTLSRTFRARFDERFGRSL
ncbi:MAG: LytR/AlgR family response regulator transcription factor [Candidatus Acidiferrales bacterium]